MITAMHLLIYSDDAAATRTFLRDVLLLESVSARGAEPEEASADDWLIFAAGPCELAVHPTRAENERLTYESPQHHSIALMCDDLADTMAELEGRGAVFLGEAQDLGWGLAVTLQVPGAEDMLLYQPRHATAYAKGLTAERIRE
ncbi:VOC family protein [Raineyella sp. LH-20]|uniref:VOC family protein n=1 Tax=Raineyella sp. LH-20 TaxID=3081204 RepID=UPI0029557490|nr:VOC family protein [Raineyella sp. LH-20]WOP20027.1 VOC family protein [Raineyella sp. LH-20]